LSFRIAVHRLEQRLSTADVTRPLEVNANVLHSWRREFREGPANAFSGSRKPRWSEGRIAELEPKSASSRWSVSHVDTKSA
jgi:transposase-like protein